MEKNCLPIKFSIIIPCWNHEETLGRTLHCVFEQSYQNYEIIIVVRDKKTWFDYTPDDSIILLEQTNKGVSNARNLGLKYATGTHVCFLDADDTWSCTYLEDLVNAIQKYPEVHSIIHNFYWRTKKNTRIKNIEIKSGLYDYFNLFSQFCQFFHPLSSTCFKNIWDKTDRASIYFNPYMPLGEDIDFITKFMLKHRICYYDNRPSVTYYAPENPHKKYTTNPVNIPALGDLLKESNEDVLNYLDIWSMSTCLQNLDRGHSARASVCLDFVSDKYKTKRRLLRVLCYVPHPIALMAHRIYNRFFWK